MSKNLICFCFVRVTNFWVREFYYLSYIRIYKMIKIKCKRISQKSIVFQNLKSNIKDNIYTFESASFWLFNYSIQYLLILIENYDFIFHSFRFGW
jgi:hypothetical protein